LADGEVATVFEGDSEGNGWLRVEEFRDADSLVSRGELPGIDPGRDVELTVANDVLDVRAERQEKSERTGKSGYRGESATGLLSARQRREPK
jgi:HSP20 family protein